MAKKAKKAALPRYTERQGWIGGDSRTLYAFTDRRTGKVGVYPGGGGSKKKLLMHVGPEADVRVATRAEAEELWQSPLSSGWNVSHARKYGPKATEKIGKTMGEFKRGKLKSSSGQKVKSRKQAIAIGISQARRAGYKVPPEPPEPAPRAHATRKTEAQLDAEIAEVVPGWAKGLDLTESRRLAKTLHVSQEALERKERVAESTRRAALPSIRIDARTGKEPGSTVSRGIYIYPSSPGIAYGNHQAIENALRADGFKITQREPRYTAVAANGDPADVAERVAEGLRRRGYRVQIGRQR